MGSMLSKGTSANASLDDVNASRRSLPPVDANQPIDDGLRARSAPAALAIPADAEDSEASQPEGETSTERDIRELRQSCVETPKEKPFHYPRFSLDGSIVSPVKEATESSRLTGSFDDPSWYRRRAYRSEPGTPSSSVNQSGGNVPPPAAVAQEEILSPSLVSESPNSASQKSISSGGVSSPMGSVAAEESGPSIPFDSTGDFNAENGSSNVSSPPQTPETSAEATPHKLMKVVRMSLERASLSPAPEGAEPTHQTLCYRRAYQSSRSSEEPMEVDKPLKRRSPSDAVLPEHRDFIRANRSRTLSSCASSRSSTSSAPSRKSPVSAEALKMRKCLHQCPLCEQTCQKEDEDPLRRTSGKNVSGKVLDWRQTPHNCPICQLKCRPMSLFSSDSEEEQSEVASVNGSINFDLDDYLSDIAIDDDVQPTEQEQPLVGIAGPAKLCHQCGRNCPCAPVQRPESPAVDAPVPQPRRRRRQEPSAEDIWKKLELVEAICDADLPAPPPTVNNDLELVDSMPLAADRLITFLVRDTFQVALYSEGEVVLQGSFLGVTPSTDILRQAAKHPVVIVNDPLDPVTMIDAGNNHIVMMTQSGNVMTLGRAVEGQLGATANPERFRQRAVNPGNLRRFPFGADDVVFCGVEASGNTTTAYDEDGNVYHCGEGYGNWLETPEHYAERLAA